MFGPADRGLVDGSHESLKPLQHHRPSEAVVRNTVGLYDGNLAYADAQIGRLVAGLRQLGIWERTVFVVMADHGEAFWEHGVRGHSVHAYEEFVRVPLLIRVPGTGAEMGIRVGRPVELVDLLPTLLELFELPPAPLAGESLLSTILDPSDEPATAYTRNHSTHRIEFAMRLGDAKVIMTGRQRKPMLFDLARDPGELVDLQDTRSSASTDSTRALGHRLRSTLQEWLARNRDAARGSIADATDSLDAESIERLRALGYFH
jgi:arylsulfatase A-like enzyme